MDVARLNMDTYEPSQMREVIENIQAASDELVTACPIFIDLKGMLIRSIVPNKPMKLVPGQVVHISDDPRLAGLYSDLFVIDCPKFAAKLRAGDKITLNYGTVELEVHGFTSKEAYLKKQRDDVAEE